LIRDPKNIIVAGSPGALINVISKRLAKQGWEIKWPNQCIDTGYGRSFYEHNGQNFEVQEIQQRICAVAGVELISDKLPVYYDLPYPGPAEFIAMFSGPVVVSAPSLPPFLDIWRVAADIVIDIQSKEDDDLAMLIKWSRNKLPVDYLKAVQQVYVARYSRHLKLFPKVFTMSNAEIIENKFESLDRFLASVMLG